jgi:hypothetical protein
MRIPPCTMQRPMVSKVTEVRWTPTRRSHFWSLASVSQRRVIVPLTGLCRGRHPLQLHMQSKQIEATQAPAAPGFGRQKRPPNLYLGRREIRAKVRSLVSSQEQSQEHGSVGQPMGQPGSFHFLKIIKIIKLFIIGSFFVQPCSATKTPEETKKHTPFSRL